MLDVNKLPVDLLKKFEMLERPLAFNSKVKLLSWFVDEMRSSVLGFLEESSALDGLYGPDRIELFAEIDAIQAKCANELFKINNDRAKGILVENSENIESVFSELSELRNKIDLVSLESSQLRMITDHNN